MNCPACKDSVLSMSDRQGIEIDYCPKCRGVWLDRGELDKIIERSANDQATVSAQPAKPAQITTDPYAFHQSSPKYYKKRKSFLEELFD